MRTSPPQTRNSQKSEGAFMSTHVISTMSRPMSTPFLVISWLCRIVAAVILLQTLFFKFTAAPESVYIFTKLGTFIHTYSPFPSISTVEVSGRIGSGIVELIAAVLLLPPRFAWAGAVLAMAATSGAIASHLTFLGVEVQGDKGLLFFLAIAVFVTSAIALFLHRMQIPVIGREF
jgi:putative oxidoreductase